MADRSAGALVDVILADDPQSAIEPLAEQLSLDPPLALWTVCQAERRDEFRPHSVSDVARWLSGRALDVLQWDGPDEDRFAAPSSGQSEPYADRMAFLVQVAELSALLAASEGEVAADEAFLLGLLHEAPRWYELSSGDAPDLASAFLPEWLLTVGQSRAGGWVAQAAEILDGDAASVPPDFDPDACRERALEARRSWLEVVDGMVDRLPVLTARLARFDALENRFQETLEAEKLEAMAEFAAGAGHEINNPLAIIGGRAQLLLREETDPERRRELALMNAQVKRAHEMIADMRLFARPPCPEPETIDVLELAEAVLSDLAPQAAERAISLTRSGDEGPLELEADPAQLNVALRALCKNSLEAIGHDGQIEVAVRGLPGHVEIRVSDDGPGVPPEHRRHLFDPFYSARQAGRGLGFGLSKCWRIVTNHGGRIEVESEPDQGATFTIVLPRRREE